MLGGINWSWGHEISPRGMVQYKQAGPESSRLTRLVSVRIRAAAKKRASPHRPAPPAFPLQPQLGAHARMRLFPHPQMFLAIVRALYRPLRAMLIGLLWVGSTRAFLNCKQLLWLRILVRARSVFACHNLLSHALNSSSSCRSRAALSVAFLSAASSLFFVTYLPYCLF